jgi:hypothetical protein
MKLETTLQDILRIEDSVDIASICCPETGIPMWTTIRSLFLRLIKGDLLYSVPLLSGGGSVGSGSRLSQMQMIARAFAHNALRIQAPDRMYSIALMATGARLFVRDGNFFNGLSDYFVSAAPEHTLVIEDLFGSQWPFPRQYSNVMIQTPLRVEGVLRGQFRLGRCREPARALVELISQRAKDELDWDIGKERRQWIERLCTSGSASLLPRYQRYHSIFRKMGARLLIKEEACYGGADNATAILAAKHLGMVTAEYQHGAVSTGHDAYNFAAAISSDQTYRQTLPDYFLTYGSWWGDQINAPVKKITIGNPHRAEALNLSSSVLANGRQILILGDGIETTSYMELCARLAEALGSFAEVVFRPHPLERASVWAKHPDGFVGKVRIDAHQDMYSSFRDSGAVVSEVSTGLFEAIGLVPKVFIWDTPKARFSYPVHPFQGFSNATQLARLILDENAGRVSTQQNESIWAPNWQRNYLEFIEKAVE